MSDIDRIVDRIKILVAKHGGQHDCLSEVRKWYSIFKACPENMALAVLEAEVTKVEAML